MHTIKCTPKSILQEKIKVRVLSKTFVRILVNWNSDFYFFLQNTVWILFEILSQCTAVAKNNQPFYSLNNFSFCRKTNSVLQERIKVWGLTKSFCKDLSSSNLRHFFSCRILFEYCLKFLVTVQLWPKIIRQF